MDFHMSIRILEFSALTPSEQAAWIQAIGTIIALAIAIGVPIALDRIRKRRTDSERESRARTLILSLLPDLYKLRASTSHFVSEESRADTDEIRERDALHGDYFSHAEAFQRILIAAPELGVFGAKLSYLVYLLFRARERHDAVTRLQIGGYHAAYLNSVDEFAGYATEIDGAAEDLIRAVEHAYDEREL